jgi:hypothetical protein
MATTLEELVVKLKADTSDYEKKLKKSQRITRTAANKIKTSFNSVRAKISGVTSGLGILKGAILGAGIGLIVKQSLDAADRLAKLSKNIGINSDMLQELSFAASQTGVNQEALNSSLMRFSRRVGEAQGGNAQYAKSFEDMGLKLTEANGKLKSSEEVFLDVADAIKANEDPAARALMAFDAFGLAGGQLINLLSQGSEGIKRYADEANKLGIVLDSEVLAEAERVNDEFDKMKRVIGTQLTKAIIELAPELKGMANAIMEVAIASQPMIKGFATALQVTRELFGATKTYDSQLKDLVDQHTSLTKKLKEVKENGGTKWNFLEWKWDRAPEIQDQLDGVTSKLQDLQTKNKEVMDVERQLDEFRKASSEGKTERDTTEQEQLELAVQKAIERNELLMGMKGEAFTTELEQNQALVDDFIKKEEKRIKAGQKASDKYLQIKKREKNAELALKENIARASQTFFSNIMTLARGSSKELFAIAKAASLATAIVQGILAVQRVFASVPYPLSIPLAAAMASTAAVNVARIASTNYARGVDSVPGVGQRDSVPAMLMPKERVIPTSTNNDLSQFLDDYRALRRSGSQAGGGAPIVIRLEFNEDFMETIDAKLVERGELNVTLEG